MKFTALIGVLVFILTASVAGASGNHAGGHGDSAVIGQPGKPEKVTRTVTVDMSDAMRFTPSSINVIQGETLRFMVKNSGKLTHEMVLGTEKELQEHYELMKKFPEMEHADENMVTVKPGATGEIVWQFTKAGTIHFGCLVPGHYEAGMKGSVKVTARKAKPTHKQ